MKQITWGSGVIPYEVSNEGRAGFLRGYIGNHIHVFSIRKAFWGKNTFVLISQLPSVGEITTRGTLSEMQGLAEDILVLWLAKAGLKS